MKTRNEYLIQILFAIYCLMRAGFRHNDIKAKNILYRKFPGQVEITYKFNDNFYIIKCDYLLILTDFGKVRKYPELKGNLETYPCKNIKDTVSVLNIFDRNYDFLCHIGSFAEGIDTTKKFLLSLLEPFTVSRIPKIFYDLDKDLNIHLTSKGLVNCFFENEKK